MTALIIVEAALIAGLTFLVVGLLRSHGEVLARLGAIEAGDGKRGKRKADRLAPGLPPLPDRDDLPVASDVTGTSPTGDALHLALASGNGPDTLLAFLSSGCLTCRDFWEAFADDEQIARLPAGMRIIAVTKDLDEESPSKLAELASDGIVVVHSSAAWDAYDVPGSPYFVYVGGVLGRVHGEGAAMSFDQVVSLLTDAMYDAQLEAARGDVALVTVRGESNGQRDSRADDALAAAGLSPDDPSFYDESSWGQVAATNGTETRG